MLGKGGGSQPALWSSWALPWEMGTAQVDGKGWTNELGAAVIYRSGPVALAPEGAAPIGDPWLTSLSSSEGAGFVSHGRRRLFTGAQEESDILAKNNSLTARVLPVPWKSSSSCTAATALFQQQIRALLAAKTGCIGGVFVVVVIFTFVRMATLAV